MKNYLFCLLCVFGLLVSCENGDTEKEKEDVVYENPFKDISGQAFDTPKILGGLEFFSRVNTDGDYSYFPKDYRNHLVLNSDNMVYTKSRFLDEVNNKDYYKKDSFHQYDDSYDKYNTHISLGYTLEGNNFISLSSLYRNGDTVEVLTDKYKYSEMPYSKAYMETFYTFISDTSNLYELHEDFYGLWKDMGIVFLISHEGESSLVSKMNDFFKDKGEILYVMHGLNSSFSGQNLYFTNGGGEFYFRSSERITAELNAGKYIFKLGDHSFFVGIAQPTNFISFTEGSKSSDSINSLFCLNPNPLGPFLPKMLGDSNILNVVSDTLSNSFYNSAYTKRDMRRKLLRIAYCEGVEPYVKNDGSLRDQLKTIANYTDGPIVFLSLIEQAFCQDPYVEPLED